MNLVLPLLLLSPLLLTTQASINCGFQRHSRQKVAQCPDCGPGKWNCRGDCRWIPGTTGKDGLCAPLLSTILREGVDHGKGVRPAAEVKPPTEVKPVDVISTEGCKRGYQGFRNRQGIYCCDSDFEPARCCHRNFEFDNIFCSWFIKHFLNYNAWIPWYNHPI